MLITPGTFLGYTSESIVTDYYGILEAVNILFLALDLKVVPGLIDMGIDVLEALQFDAAGMDPVVLKRDFGDNLSFHGGISVQTTMPFGSPEAVRAEVEERVRVLGQGGGYILAPSHAIQAGTPLENVLALLEASGQDCTKR